MRPLSNSINSRGLVFGVVIICLFGLPAQGQPWLGSGTEGDPYQIWTPADMQAIGGNSAYWGWGTHFELMADIDIGAYTGTSFNMIGTFLGVFDGNGHTISNFSYDSNNTDYIGIFRFCRGAKIKDLGLINPNVDAGNGDRVGALVGGMYENWGIIGIGISNCYIEGGSVSGDDKVGGLVGFFQESGSSNCYSTASVSGTTNVGGLVGRLGGGGKIKNCYSKGSVSGVSLVGGLAGRGGNMTNCYSSFWDTQTSGQSSSSGGTGKTTAEMQTASTFIGWNGCGSEEVWVLDEGNDYPRLWWENKPGEPLPTENLSDFVAGAGTEQDPYLIETGEQMNLIGVFWCEWDKHFKLMADIDLSAYTGTSFNIIGIFEGVFDGNGHTISNFSYDSNNTGNIGIFTHSHGKISDLGLINPNVDGGTGNHVGSLIGLGGGRITGCYVEGGSVSGNDYVGGLAGGNGGLGIPGGTITNCSSNTSVSGHWYVGGLTGYNTSSKITNCSSNASVSGDTYVGGLVGRNDGQNARISNCYSTGTVSGVSEVGGLVGSNGRAGDPGGPVTNCYSTASVSGIFYLGGLVGTLRRGGIYNCYSAGSVSGVSSAGGLLGYKETGSIADSFWDTETSGQATSDGGVGLPTELMQSAFIFTSVGWDFFGETTNGSEDIWRLCNEGGEYPQLSWQYLLGDFGCPDGVDWSDLAVLCEQWLQVGAYSADIAPAPAGDGIVNFPDFAALADNWLTGL